MLQWLISVSLFPCSGTERPVGLNWIHWMEYSQDRTLQTFSAYSFQTSAIWIRNLRTQLAPLLAVGRSTCCWSGSLYLLLVGLHCPRTQAVSVDDSEYMRRHQNVANWTLPCCQHRRFPSGEPIEYWPRRRSQKGSVERKRFCWHGGTLEDPCTAVSTKHPNNRIYRSQLDELWSMISVCEFHITHFVIKILQ